jgi:sulfate permease, SulP family
MDFQEQLSRVRIDATKANIWDLTGVNAIDTAVLKFRRQGAVVECWLFIVVSF